MDGCHIPAVITPKEDEIPYFVERVMQPRMSWQFAILTCCSHLSKLDGKYYLVDAGYANTKGYLAPFIGKNARYHLPDYRRSTQPPIGYFEIFNYAHASLRNVIERSFGVWKNRWRILFNMPSYKFSTQCKIVVVTMALHNFIRQNALQDEEFDKCDANPNYMPNVEDSDDPNENDIGNSESNGDASDTESMTIVRNSIATSLMNTRGFNL